MGDAELSHAGENGRARRPSASARANSHAINGCVPIDRPSKHHPLSRGTAPATGTPREPAGPSDISAAARTMRAPFAPDAGTQRQPTASEGRVRVCSGRTCPAAKRERADRCSGAAGRSTGRAIERLAPFLRSAARAFSVQASTGGRVGDAASATLAWDQRPDVPPSSPPRASSSTDRPPSRIDDAMHA